jgi:hypothetical protein
MAVLLSSQSFLFKALVHETLLLPVPCHQNAYRLLLQYLKLHHTYEYVGFEVFTAVVMKSIIF